MWFNERYTFSRGRSGVPSTFLRIRSCTLRRVTFLDVCVSMKIVLGRWSFVVGQNQNPIRLLGLAAGSLANDQRPTTGLFCSRLSNLLLQALACVAHALILIRIRRTQGAHLGRNLPDFLAIDPAD